MRAALQLMFERPGDGGTCVEVGRHLRRQWQSGQTLDGIVGGRMELAAQLDAPTTSAKGNMPRKNNITVNYFLQCLVGG